MFLYGGPGSQKVLNEYGGNNFYWHQMLAQKGYQETISKFYEIDTEIIIEAVNEFKPLPHRLEFIVNFQKLDLSTNS